MPISMMGLLPAVAAAESPSIFRVWVKGCRGPRRAGAVYKACERRGRGFALPGARACPQLAATNRQCHIHITAVRAQRAAAGQTPGTAPGCRCRPQRGRSRERAAAAAAALLLQRSALRQAHRAARCREPPQAPASSVLREALPTRSRTRPIMEPEASSRSTSSTTSAFCCCTTLQRGVGAAQGWVGVGWGPGGGGRLVRRLRGCGRVGGGRTWKSQKLLQCVCKNIGGMRGGAQRQSRHVRM